MELKPWKSIWRKEKNRNRNKIWEVLGNKKAPKVYLRWRKKEGKTRIEFSEKRFATKKMKSCIKLFWMQSFFWRFHSIFIVFSFPSIKMMSLCNSETLGVSALSFQKEIPSAELQRTWDVEALNCIWYSLSSPGFTPASTFSALSSLDLSQKFEPPQVPFAH